MVDSCIARMPTTYCSARGSEEHFADQSPAGPSRPVRRRRCVREMNAKGPSPGKLVRGGASGDRVSSRGPRDGLLPQTLASSNESEHLARSSIPMEPTGG